MFNFQSIGTKELLKALLIVVLMSSISFRETISQESSSVGDLQSGFAWGVEADATNKFMWRGITFNEGLVIQPNLFASFGNFSGGIWGNYVAFDRHGYARKHEIDLVLSYSWALGRLKLDHTFMAYFYPGQEDPPTGEFFLTAGLPVGVFTIVTTVAADIVTYAGSLYLEHGIEYSLELGSSLTLDAALNYSWGNRTYFETYIGTDRISSGSAGVSLQMTYLPEGPVYFRPHFQLYRTLNREVAGYIGRFPTSFGLLIGFEI
jgi:hypothetical protein